MRESHNWFEDDFRDRDSSLAPTLELDPWHSDKIQEEMPQCIPDESDNSTLKFDSATNTSWDIDDLTGDAFPDQLDCMPIEQEEWVEPEATAEPVSTLGEPLYPPDYGITDVSRELKIGEFLALVSPCAKEQFDRCHELLSECGLGRLRRLIPWLRRHTWCGEKLQLLLEFRDYWESKSNASWWEIFYWDYFDQSWIPKYYNNTLTLDHARELVEIRAGRVATEVVCRSWFNDWEDSMAWEHGIRSFASFAVLRARFADGYQWREYLETHDRRTALEVAQCVDPDFAPFMLPSIGRQYACSPMIVPNTDPWPDMTDMALRRAAALGGNLAQAWEEIIYGIADL